MSLSSEYRTALVTGASSGLGAAFAAMLVDEGVEVWGTARDRDRVPDRGRFHGLALELSDPASIDAAWSAAEAASGGIDLLVNNAGGGTFGPFAAFDAGAWADQLEVLLHGPARLARAALPAMLGRGRGCIVQVSSLAAEFPIPFMSAYDAAKAGLSALSACLDLECAATCVRVIDFRPGDYRTSFNHTMRTLPDTHSSGTAARVRARLEGLMRDAPPPERAARDLAAALRRRRRGVVRSGSFFQARLAPWLQRWAPLRLSVRIQRGYFQLD